MRLFCSCTVSRSSLWVLVFSLLGFPLFGQSGRFREVPAAESGLDFQNTLREDSIWNYFRYQNLYNGAGVATGDLNNDGLPDLYFVGNQVPNRLYLNLGGFRFREVTAEAGVAGPGLWGSGVTLADVNGDGWLDIYVCQAGHFGHPDALRNLLYLNNGDGRQGHMSTFREAAREYGIDDPGRSVQATFLDYDRDNDLDLYVVNHPDFFQTPYEERLARERNPNFRESDHLYRNDGPSPDGQRPVFTEVTAAAGVANWAFGLGVVASDLNGDGWTDLYVANDYSEADRYWINQGDGSFRDGLQEAFAHISNFSMGVDAGDFNNDGLPDLVVVDMMARDNRRKKTNMSGMNPEAFWENVADGRHLQYMQNVLQLNNGNGTFSDVAEMAGVAFTDWSWSPLLADLDNDGRKDLLVTNGMRREVRYNDFSRKLKGQDSRLIYAQWDSLTRSMPVERVPNFCFRNVGDLEFEEVGADWGLDQMDFSNGAALADLDGDGDLDLVLNNLDGPARMLENRLAGARSLRIQPIGPRGNSFGLGLKAWLYGDRGVQYAELTATRGFLSASEPWLHFGVAPDEHLDSLVLVWPDGRHQLVTDVPSEGRLAVLHSSARAARPSRVHPKGTHLMEISSKSLQIVQPHFEQPFDDYEQQVLLPHTYSKNGPCLSVGDVNGDGREDFFVGGAKGSPGQLYVQQKDGTFERLGSGPWYGYAPYEDLGSLFFDADGDGDLDLYVVTGSNELPDGSPNYQDRLYRNLGGGKFEDASDMLPKTWFSGGRVAAADMDGDGDQDLFVGGRVTPGAYPSPPPSMLLVNEGGRFVDGTAERAPALQRIGMVTDAAWTDVDGDGDADLMVCGEWMAPTLLVNSGGKLTPATTGLESHVGWWYRLLPHDLDGDGDVDFVAGNLGLNTKYQASPEEPFLVYGDDLDGNGQFDIVLGYHQDGVPFPVRGRQCSSEQIPSLKKKFPTYEAFGQATLPEIYGGALGGALHYEATWMESAWLENLGNHRFAIHALPRQAQRGPVNGILVKDIDGDGQEDLILAGGLYDAEVETCRHDGSVGTVLKGLGQGHFVPMHPSESGFLTQGDVKDMALIRTDSGWRILVGRNHATIQVFSTQP